MNPKSKGFTLAELLIALGILGLIAAFTIPKILEAGTNNKKNTVFKQAIAAFEMAVLEGHSLGLTQGGLEAYLSTRINYVEREHKNTSDTLAFYDPVHCTVQGGNGYGYLLHNGAVVCGISSSSPDDRFVIDWNGSDGPNTWGDDILLVVGNGSNTDYVCVGGGIVAPGEFKPYLRPPDTTLYEEIFSN